MGNTPPSALQYVRNGRKALMDGLKFPITAAKQLNKHGILSEEELCAIRGQSGRADATSKLLDMVITKGEQACYELLQILQNIPEMELPEPQSFPAPQHSPEKDFYHWINQFSLKGTKGPTETSLPRLIGNDLHLDVKEDEDETVFEEAGAIMKQHPEKMRLYLHVDQDFQHLGEALRDMIVKCLPQISRISVRSTGYGIGSSASSAYSGIDSRLPDPINNFLLQLFLQAALNEAQTGQKTVMLLSEVIGFHTIFEANVYNGTSSQRNTEFLIDLFSHIKDFETEKGKSLQAILHPVYQSTPAVWDIDLSKGKASILCEVMKFQTEKKAVNIIKWSDEGNEQLSFLQCLPYISHLRLSYCCSYSTEAIRFIERHFYSTEVIRLIERHFNSTEAFRFIASLFIQAAECDRETGEKKLQLLSSVCSYSSFPFAGDTNTDGDLKRQSDFLLDLYSFLKDCENPSRRNVLLALQPVYQSSPAVWVIDLSERKVSILLKVLELQTVKKPAKLVGWSDEENEQRSLLQCLSYVSGLDISKQLLQQLLSLISVGDDVQVTRQAASLSRALGREVDLSHILIDPQTCMSLAMVLEQAEGLSKLDLSHCQLNDHRVELLLPHLHKAQVLDLSNNDISDLGALRIHSVVSTSSYIQTVRLFNNRITDTATFLTDPRYDLWDQLQGQITVELKPDLNSHNGELCYSLSCESGGHFQCRETGLVFLMKAAGKVEYSPTYWDEAALKTAGYEPAGPLFNIQNPEEVLCSLQLPHCEADVEGREHLSVAHFCGGNMEVLKPMAVTDTHVKIHVQDLSLFGIVRSILSLITSSVHGQVLLFQPRRSTIQKQIYVFLLPSNVPLSQVSEQHKECVYIKTSSDCTLTPNQKYSLTSDLEVHHEIQPKSQEFFWNFGPNFHPTFEMFFSNDITALQLAVLENGECEVWARKVHLSAEAVPDAAEIETHQTRQHFSSLQLSNFENCHVSQIDWKDYLLDVLDELTDEELKNLRMRMPPPAGHKGIPKSKLHGADRPDLRNFMVERWGVEGSITATKEGLSKIQRNDLIEELNDFLQKLSL